MKSHTYPEYDLDKAANSKLLIGLWKLMHGYHWQYIGATIALGISAASRTGIYMLLGFYVDEILKKSRFDSALLLTALAFLLLVISQAAFSFISGWLAALTAEGTTRRLRDYLFDHIQRLSYAYHAETKTGDMLERATSDVDAIRRFFSDQAIGIGRIILIFVINLVAIINVNPKLVWVSVGIIPIILVISIFFFKVVSKAYEAYQDQEAILSTALQENLSGVRVVKAFARQNYEIYKFEQINWEKFKRGRKLNKLHSYFWPFSDIFCAAQLWRSMVRSL
jgi:ATP-binding cassette subfamily B protein